MPHYAPLLAKSMFLYDGIHPNHTSNLVLLSEIYDEY
jgi:hypothetical protein